ncbi:hypothetical protein ET989_02955 [Propioniciclava sinopodophylli]|uniref:Cell division protein FtsL n=1 Tax=Propioniciclava sinopodophylli TaxID=1837344 RepID=A0A4Q9KHE1_9ACTN|nr:hypothetical protein [Propioniciclava sinopodophylli]TBT87286.1 hypothetical protein ET989_02955 [Propioniciclava sinopodophylli]
MTAWETIREAPRRIGEAAAQARPQLRSITSPRRRMAGATFAVFVIGLFFSGMVGMLLLTTLLQNQAFEIRAAQRTASELSYRASDLEAQVNRAKAPVALGQRAAALGMVPNPRAVFIDLSTGEVLGKPVPVRGDEIPSLTRVPVVPPLEDEVPPADAPPADGAQPAEGEPAADAPAAEQPAAEQPAAEQPAAEQPTATDTAGATP